MTSPKPSADVKEQVRAHYAAAARSVTDQLGDRPTPASCCGDSVSSCAPGPQLVDLDPFGSTHYGDKERADLPAAAVAASLGCGNPTAVADLAAGDVVLDLGSGGGIDVILSAKRVGPTGKAYGLDMTDEMHQLALRNVAEAGVTNVEFLHGHIEDIPLPDQSVDVVISNCVINLSLDKAKVFAEIARVLRPGGRLGVTDIVAEDRLTPEQRAERGDFAGCIAGALSTSEYLDGLASAGLADATVTFTHEIVDGMHNAIIKARRPSQKPANGTTE